MSPGHKMSIVKPWSPAGACQHCIMGQKGFYLATPLPEELLAVMVAVREESFSSLVKPLVIHVPVNKLPLTIMQVMTIKPSGTPKKKINESIRIFC